MATLPALAIELACHRHESVLELLITFTNTQETAQKFTFSNQDRKAELLGLQVTSQAGQWVMPAHNLVIKLSNSEPVERTLAGGATFSYLLSGNVTEYGLEFPGALFKLNPGEPYQVYFQYSGRRSNSVTLVL